jgi:hypothetical protein
LSLERSELGPRSSFEEGTKRVHVVDDKRAPEALAEPLTECGEIRLASRRYAPLLVYLYQRCMTCG